MFGYTNKARVFLIVTVIFLVIGGIYLMEKNKGQLEAPPPYTEESIPLVLFF